MIVLVQNYAVAHIYVIGGDLMILKCISVFFFYIKLANMSAVCKRGSISVCDKFHD